MPQHETIIVRGAREHNLKNIDVEIPRDKLVVLTGLSGSGKSSLAFDTIFAEGQRRYVESLSAYARQFLGQMEKPDVDHIEGLSPAISIDQKGTSRNPRSTVGTVTEIYDYLRLLFARIGRPHCPQLRPPDHRTSRSSRWPARSSSLPDGSRLMILAPVIRDRKGEHQAVLEEIRRQGFVRVRVDGEVHDVDEAVGSTSTKYKKHTIEVVVDRLVVRHEPGVGPDDHPDRVRVIESLETALKHRQRHRRRPDRRRRGARLLREVRLPRALRHQLRRDRAAQLLLQLAPRRLPRPAPASAPPASSTRS